MLLVAKTARGKEVFVLCQKAGEGLPVLNCLSKTCLMRIQIKTTLQFCIKVQFILILFVLSFLRKANMSRDTSCY